MANVVNQSVNVEDEIDFRQLIKILINSKKLIFLTILIFTIASFIYTLTLKPSFKTSTILEIGYFYEENGDRELIESPSDLISDLNILLLKNPDGKFSQNVAMNSLEGKVINLETTSNSVEQNEKILNSFIAFIENRHNELSIINSNLSQNTLLSKIDLIDSEISFIKAKQLDENQSKKLTINFNLESVESELSFIKAKQLSKIEDRLTKLTNELPIIDLEISQLERVIMEDTNNLSLLKGNDNMLQARAANSPTLQEKIFSYESKINSLNRKKSSYILEIKILNNQLENVSLQSDELFNLEQRQKNLKNELKTLKNVSLQSDELFNLEQRQKTLEIELQTLISQTPVKTRPIGDIQTITIKSKTQLMISLGIILGFFTSILLVFIRNFVKSYKESEA